ncbi:MAG: CDP-alcohol phosphatidyltransferase family protein [Thermoguttaceae bacterium]|nr:CDP-alcohol phosphatidyltransferase family protein [Thermoguttaceae bacterium]
MPEQTNSAAGPVSSIWNVPNVLTFARIFFSVALFVVMPFHWYLAALILFCVGALTDYFDGWWARKYHQVTKLGRIVDPFADKLLICGTLIYLIAEPDLAVPLPGCGINIGLAPWMVVVIVSRELLVTLLRSVIESGGGDFSAKWAGKVKMACQCFAVIAALLFLEATRREISAVIPFLKWTMVALLWVTVYLTVDSCVKYIAAAIRAAKTTND